MQIETNLHQKVIQEIECQAQTDPLAEMAATSFEKDGEDFAPKYIALMVLHGLNAGAKKIKVEKQPDGSVCVTAKYRKKQLPSPSDGAAGLIFEAAKQIAGFEDPKGKTPFVVGVGEASVELGLKYEADGKESLSIKFPELTR